MEFTIDKPKIKQGYSYALKSSWLQEAVAAHQLQTRIHLIYRPPREEQADWTLVKGEYWFPNQRVDYPRFYIQVGGVSIHLKPQVEVMVRTAIIPQLMDWMVQQEKLDIQSTLLKKDFLAVLKDKALIIS